MTYDIYTILGGTGIKVSQIGLGTMQWGYKSVNNQFSSGLKDIPCEIFKTSLDSGINFFDTAEMYGSGNSEKNLGRCTKQGFFEIVIASKFMPYPWRLTRSELPKALKKSLRRLEKSSISLYQMHWPFPPVPINSWMDAMADLVAEGLIKAVGVSNYSMTQTQKAYERLAKYGIPLASNQIKYSMLDKRAEKNGVITLCNELNVKVIAYSPLEKGILTGKYNPNNIPTDFRSWRYNKSYFEKINPLINELRNLGNKYGGKTPGQVALNWLVCKGALPIPGARSVEQAIDNAGALGWMLSQEDVVRLNSQSDSVSK